LKSRKCRVFILIFVVFSEHPNVNKSRVKSKQTVTYRTISRDRRNTRNQQSDPRNFRRAHTKLIENKYILSSKIQSVPSCSETENTVSALEISGSDL